jgi:hypothetical protein
MDYSGIGLPGRNCSDMDCSGTGYSDTDYSGAGYFDTDCSEAGYSDTGRPDTDYSDIGCPDYNCSDMNCPGPDFARIADIHSASKHPAVRRLPADMAVVHSQAALDLLNRIDHYYSRMDYYNLPCYSPLMICLFAKIILTYIYFCFNTFTLNFLFCFHNIIY